MIDFINFISENYMIIIVVAIAIFGLLVFISVKNIKLETPTVDKKLDQVITVETFKPLDDNYYNGDKYSFNQ